MPLIDLKTNLKSLKYGNDRLGNGSSGEPFITEPIPEGDTPGASTDFILRQGAIRNSGKDASRLTQLLFSTTRGLLFTTGNQLLSRTSVKTEATLGPAYAGGAINQGVYLPTSTIAQSLAGFSGTHLNLLGINPSSPTAGVVEGGGSVNLFPDGGLIRYSNAVKLNESINENRLVELFDSKILGGRPSVVSLVSQNPLEILSYNGGPGSVLGVGKTKIKRATNTTGISEYGGSTVKDFLQISFNRVTEAKTYFNNNYSSKEQEINTPLGKITLKAVSSGSYNVTENYPQGVVSNNEIITLKTAYIKPDKTPITYNPNASSESDDTLTSYTQRSYQSNPDFILRKYGNLAAPVSGSKQYTYTGDKFSATNTNKLNTETLKVAPSEDQLFKFFLNLINPQSPGANNYLYWQAYVDNFSDSVNSNYDSFTYTGRGYPSYRYKGFTRAISLDFTIVAERPGQIVPIYTKLNTLIQNLAPNYGNSGYIRGNFARLTFGDYLDDVPGIINGFTINPIFEAGFDTGTGEEETTSGKQLPKAIKISGFNFTPITSNDKKLVSDESRFISY